MKCISPRDGAYNNIVGQHYFGWSANKPLVQQQLEMIAMNQQLQ